jgi:hypothetical protein
MSAKVIEPATKPDDEGRKTLSGSPRWPLSWIREGDGGTTSLMDQNGRRLPARFRIVPRSRRKSMNDRHG